MAKNFTEVKDSGARQDFGTGSVRDTSMGKGRFDLIPPYALLRIAKHYENGSSKYGPRNWEKGQPLSRYLDSAFRHMNKIMMGLEDEDHLSAACWNLMGIIETQKRIELGLLTKELDDLPSIYKNSFDSFAEFKCSKSDDTNDHSVEDGNNSENISGNLEEDKKSEIKKSDDMFE